MAAFILDLDGTLVDSVYQHVMAWQAAFRSCGFQMPGWRIHRKVGMSGDLLMSAFAADLDRELDDALRERLQSAHTEHFAQLRADIRPFAGANELLSFLRQSGHAVGIASTGHRKDIGPLLELLDLPDGTPVVTKEDASMPKPHPELFLSAAKKLGAASEETVVVGDSVWDMLAARRAHFLGVGLLCGGYAEAEMSAAGAFRVYGGPDDLRRHLYETGVSVKERT